MRGSTLLVIPAALQALVMLVDEGYYHRRRGLPRWERLGHPIDTLSVALCYAWLCVSTPGDASALVVYGVLAAFSCLLVTKDEAVHARVCSPGEHWLHAVLFILHPVVFAGFGVVWWLAPDGGGALWMVQAQLALTCGLMIYQLLYWSRSEPWPSTDP